MTEKELNILLKYWQLYRTNMRPETRNDFLRQCKEILDEELKL